MRVIKYPDRKNWAELLKRPQSDKKEIFSSVKNILEQVRVRGDQAIRELAKKFDGIELNDFRVTEKEFLEAEKKISNELKNAIEQAAKNITSFHRKQILQEEIVETMPGIKCWRKSVAIEKVGLYIPGGTAPLFSTLLMLAIPAKLAGSKEIIVCTPANKNSEIDAAILYTASFLGIDKIYKIGGAQAIAAMAYGTETISPVYKIFGPGNNYVTAAKQLVQLDGISIDMPAGPSEVAIFADATGNAAFIAADLLSQAEHGADSQVLLITTDETLIEEVISETEKQLSSLPRNEIAKKSLESSLIILVKDEVEAMKILNDYAPEHLILSCANADLLAMKVFNAGSVFIGNFSPEAVGDYASGTNHTLPTNGFAKAYSGVSVDSFVKKITFQKLDETGLKNISKTVITMAEAEGLDAHANAIKIRINV